MRPHGRTKKGGKKKQASEQTERHPKDISQRVDGYTHITPISSERERSRNVVRDSHTEQVCFFSFFAYPDHCRSQLERNKVILVLAEDAGEHHDDGVQCQDVFSSDIPQRRVGRFGARLPRGKLP